MAIWNRRTALKGLLTSTAAVGTLGIANACTTDKKPPSQNTPLKNNIKQSVCRWCFQDMPLDQLCAAAKEMGIKRIPDFNTGDNEGISYFHVNQKRGRRWSSARGFLKPVLNRSHARPRRWRGFRASAQARWRMRQHAGVATADPGSRKSDRSR